MVVITGHRISELKDELAELDDVLAELDERIGTLLVATVPQNVSRSSASAPRPAAALVMAAGDNPERLHSEAPRAHLCGVSPIPKGSGKSSGRVKAHDGGDRQANSALWRIIMVRVGHDPETRLYVERRLKEGKTNMSPVRCVRRRAPRQEEINRCRQC